MFSFCLGEQFKVKFYSRQKCNYCDGSSSQTHLKLKCDAALFKIEKKTLLFPLCLSYSTYCEPSVEMLPLTP